MNQSKILELIPKIIIWFCLVVILFSPLYLSSHLFFPFITTKTFTFNIAIEVMFLAFLFLAWKKSEYRIRVNLVVVLFAVYIVLLFISSLLGNDFYHSFWSNNERSEGLLLLLHLFLFLLVLSGFFRKIKDWLLVFDIFFLSSFSVALIALGQYFNLSWLLASGGGQRLAGTIGNAGYMAGYLIFAVFFGLLLIFKRKKIYLTLYYSGVIILEIFIIFNTGTRGGMLALLIGVFFFVLYLFFFYFNNKKLKLLGLVFILSAIIVPNLLFANKNSDFVKNIKVLRRVFSISLNDTTTQNRLMTWQSAFTGFKEKPIFGWGYENFYQPFDKYFNPQIFRHDGSVIWYDRAHNIIFDRLVTGGILGLISYLAFLFAPFFFLWRYYLKLEKEKKGKYFIPFIFTLIILAYFIQNLFIFEALVTYIPLFLILGFTGLFGRHYDFKVFENRNFKLISLSSFFLLFLVALYFINIKPLQVNLDLTKALSDKNLSIEQRFELFKQVLSQNTNGNQEYRRQLYNFLEAAVGQKFSNQEVVSDLMRFTENELNQQLAENPHSVSNYLLVMRFNNFMFGQTGKLDYADRNLELFERAKDLSPSRQVIYFEIGYTNVSLGSYFKRADQKEMAEKYYNLAVDNFKYALELNDNNFESYRQLINSLIYAGRNQKIIDLISQMDQKEKTKEMEDYDHVGFFTSVINTGVSVKNYQIVKLVAEKLIDSDSNNPQYYIQLAMAQAYLGENDEAIKAAQKVAGFGSEYAKQSVDFIERVKKGEFKQ